MENLNKILLFGICFSILLVSFQFDKVFAQDSQQTQLPGWFKNNAQWWYEGSITEQEIINAIENLMEEGIIIIDIGDIKVPESAPTGDVRIPSYVKDVFGFWADDLISDTEIGNSLKFLIGEGIISSPTIKASLPVDEKFALLLEISDNLIKKAKEATPKPPPDDLGVQVSMLEDQFEELTVDEIIALGTDSSVDTDKDGIPDADEIQGTLGYKTDPNKADTDGDGLNDLREYWWNTVPACPDTKCKDSNGDFILDGESVDNPAKRVFPYATLESGKDPDGDGLPTPAELYEIFTDHRSYSTDGDKYDDGQEFFKISTRGAKLPSYVPADPLAPATPDIVIDVQPKIKLNLSQEMTVGTKTMEGGETTFTSTKESKRSLTGTASAALTYTSILKAGVPPDTSEVSIGLQYQVEAKVVLEATAAVALENSDKTFNAQEAYTLESTNYHETTIQIWIDISNIGDDVLESNLQEILLNYYIGTDEDAFHSYEVPYSFTNLIPNEGPKTFTIKEIPLTLKEFQRIMAGEAVQVRVERFSFGDDQRYLLNAKASSIEIVLVSDGVKKKYIPASSPITLKMALDRAGYDYELTGDGKNFKRIDDMVIHQGPPLPYTYWTVYITKPNSGPPQSLEYLAELVLEKGDRVVVKASIDTDGDLLTDEDELLIGTDPEKVDTDGDGLRDGYRGEHEDSEIKGELHYVNKISGRTPHPLIWDTDRDKISDGDEIIAGTDPLDGVPARAPIINLYTTSGYDDKLFVVNTWKVPDFSTYYTESENEVPDVGICIIDHDNPDFFAISCIPVNPDAFDNNIESLKVNPVTKEGFGVVMYENKEYRGNSKIFTANTPNLNEMNNVASSLKIFDRDDGKPWVILYQSGKGDYEYGKMYSTFLEGKEIPSFPGSTGLVLDDPVRLCWIKPREVASILPYPEFEQEVNCSFCDEDDHYTGPIPTVNQMCRYEIISDPCTPEGRSYKPTADISVDFDINWSVEVSAFDIPAGYIAELYQKENFDGNGVVIVYNAGEDRLVLQNDKVGSVKLYGEEGWKVVLYNSLGSQCNDEYQSLVLNDKIYSLIDQGRWKLDSYVDMIDIAPGNRVLLYGGSGYTNCVYWKENTSDDIMTVEFEEELVQYYWKKPLFLPLLAKNQSQNLTSFPYTTTNHNVPHNVVAHVFVRERGAFYFLLIKNKKRTPPSYAQKQAMLSNDVRYDF